MTALKSALKIGLIACGVTSFAGIAGAGEDPIETRQQVMSTVGAATKAAGDMVQGKTEFNAVTAELAMRALASSAAAFPHYFPGGSETGGETEALPVIWEKKAEFDAISLRMEVAAVAGIPAAKEGFDAFRASFGPVVQTCKACHETFRQAN